MKPISPLLDSRTLVDLKSGNIAVTTKLAEQRDFRSLHNTRPIVFKPRSADKLIGNNETFVATKRDSLSNVFEGDNVGVGSSNITSIKPAYQSQTITERNNSLAFSNQNTSGVNTNPINSDVKVTQSKTVAPVVPEVPVAAIKTMLPTDATPNKDVNVATASVTSTPKPTVFIVAACAIAVVLILKG